MNTTHEQMMALTADMPMKAIVINRETYLERYFSHELFDGTQVWYHRFLRNDSERHLHTHPWMARSTILVGQYTEEISRDGIIFHQTRKTGEHHIIFQSTLHRIVEVEPNTWTKMVVSPGRKETWEFVDEAGNKTEMPTSPFEWHKDFKARAA